MRGPTGGSSRGMEGPAGGSGRGMGGPTGGGSRGMGDPTGGGSRGMGGPTGGSSRGMTGGRPAGAPGGAGHAPGRQTPAPHGGMRRRPQHPPMMPFGMRDVPGMRMGYDDSWRVFTALEALMNGSRDMSLMMLVERFFGRRFAPHEYADLYYWMRDYMRMW